MTSTDLKNIHSLVVADKWQDAGNYVLARYGKKGTCNKGQALTILRNLFQHLLDAERYLDAATLQWGPDIFSTEPESVKRAFHALHTGSTVLLMGASSMSKTYSAGAWMLLDYLRDPQFTTVKLAAVNEDHLKKNLFAHVATLYRSLAIPVAADIVIRDSDLYLGIKGAGFEFGISGIAFKQSQETSGQFKGYKARPVKRDKPHAQFGVMSRLRVLGDEAQNWPNGPFKDFNSLTASKTGSEIIKVVVAFNPESTSQHVVDLATPEQGWTLEDMETLYDWKSKSDWLVCRLDAARSENVIQRKEIYRGLQTYEGYMGYLKSGGDSSANYFCADTLTEVLSKDGWKKHGEIGVGDWIYTLNPKSGNAEWLPVKEVFQKQYDGSLTSMEGRGFSALVTGNHRWPITDKGKIKRNKPYFNFKETRNLGNHDLIPLIANYNHNLDDVGDSDIAELIGWVLSDGTLCAYKKVVVYQSHEANGLKCDHIRALLNRLTPKFTESKNSPTITEFGFSGELAEIVRHEVGPKKELKMDLILKLSHKGRLGLMEGLMLGDGGYQGGATRYFCTSKEKEANTFSALAALSGYATTTHKRWIQTNFKLKNGWVSPGCWMWYVNLRKSKTTRIENMEIKPSFYSGVVWCPRTDNGTFLARRNGTTYFTGNTFARGWPPMKSSVNTIILPTWPQEARGEATFIETPEDYAAIDLAFMGKDSAQMAIGRWGKASGWRDSKGEVITFKDRLDIKKNKPRHVLQIDQILPLQKHDDTIKMAEEIIGRCKMLGIKPENVAIDKTGYGFGTWSHLAKIWGDIYGISWNEKATEKKILSEDLDPANKQADGVMSEMWWAFRRWLAPETRAILINPIIPPNPIHTQLTSRRYKNGKSGIKVEPKEEYVARNKYSPDESDALVMLVHIVRHRSEVLPGLTEQQAPSKDTLKGMTGHMPSIKMMSFKDMADGGEEPDKDSISEDSRGD